MKRKNPTTVRGWAAKYRREMKERDGALADVKHAASIERAALKRKLNELENRLFVFEQRERNRRQRKHATWADYDRAADLTTSAEVELFKASPAYQRYQEFRRARVAKQSRPQNVGEAGFNPLSGRTPPT
jgi:hypothetical protein